MQHVHFCPCSSVTWGIAVFSLEIIFPQTRLNSLLNFLRKVALSNLQPYDNALFKNYT